MEKRNPRRQGDLGEMSAIRWFLERDDAYVFLPMQHSRDFDFLVDLDRRLLRVQVKTSTQFRRQRWDVAVCTRGGNQSWNGLVKRLDPAQYDYLFVLVGDGRRWWIPSAEVGGGNGIRLGGPRYAAFEIERDPVGLRALYPDGVAAPRRTS